MPSPNRMSSIGRMIAVCVLPCLSFYSFRIILYNLFTSGPGESFLERCHPGNTLFENAARRYTGNEALDWQMCFLVTFMRDALDGHRAPFMGEFYAALGPAVILPAIEMRRSGYRTSTTLVCMLILGALYQNLSGAVTLPLWWTLHFLFSGSQTVPLRPHDVEATFLGYLLGYLIISVATTIYQTVSLVAVWQVFPACIVLVQALYLYYHQRSTVEETPGCPYEVLQLIHVTNFCWSTISHAYTLFQALISPAPLDSLKHSFYPTFSPASLALSSSISQGVLKWDILLIVASTLFAGIWLLPGARPKLLAIGWFCAGSLCFGMGAGISGIWMWREKVLEEDRRASVVLLKEE